MKNKNILNIFESIVEDKYMIRYIALNRAVQLMYQHLHWITKGTSFYSDHLLFERLYLKLTEEIDQVAEKSIGLSSEESACPIMSTRLASKLLDSMFPDFNTSGDASYFVECAIYLEMLFLDQNKRLYDALSKNDSITLGLDDMIMSIHSSHEENLYLLRQRYKAESIV